MTEIARPGARSPSDGSAVPERGREDDHDDGRPDGIDGM